MKSKPNIKTPVLSTRHGVRWPATTPNGWSLACRKFFPLNYYSAVDARMGAPSEKNVQFFSKIITVNSIAQPQIMSSILTLKFHFVFNHQSKMA
jgi:hypothetical protein